MNYLLPRSIGSEMRKTSLLLLLCSLFVINFSGCGGEKAPTAVIEQPTLSPEEQAAADAAYLDSMK